jgi:hypothetical protein
MSNFREHQFRGLKKFRIKSMKSILILLSFGQSQSLPFVSPELEAPRPLEHFLNIKNCQEWVKLPTKTWDIERPISFWIEETQLLSYKSDSTCEFEYWWWKVIRMCIEWICWFAKELWLHFFWQLSWHGKYKSFCFLGLVLCACKGWTICWGGTVWVVQRLLTFSTPYSGEHQANW